MIIDEHCCGPPFAWSEGVMVVGECGWLCPCPEELLQPLCNWFHRDFDPVDDRLLAPLLICLNAFVPVKPINLAVLTLFCCWWSLTLCSLLIGNSFTTIYQTSIPHLSICEVARNWRFSFSERWEVIVQNSYLLQLGLWHVRAQQNTV